MARQTTYITRNRAAQILNCHVRTISRTIKLKDILHVPMGAFQKAFQLDGAFLEDALAGRDYAVTLPQAVHHLGLDHDKSITLKLVTAGRSHQVLKPIGRLQKGPRFSARRLGMITGDASEASHGS